MTETRQAGAGKTVVSWAVEPDENVWVQSSRAARLPFVENPVALMPDAHVGIGATVGSVIATKDAIIPAAVGVDIGCGMVASQTNLRVEELPDLKPLMPLVEDRIPAGVGQGFSGGSSGYGLLSRTGTPATRLTDKQITTAHCQFGTLGSGNHFAEVSVDEAGVVWTVLHSGSRGIGNQLAQMHIARAKGIMKERFTNLEDPDLAF